MALVLCLSLAPWATAFSQPARAQEKARTQPSAVKEIPVCVDRDVSPARRRRLWASRAEFGLTGCFEAESALQRWEIEEALQAENVTGLMRRSLSRKKMHSRDLLELLTLDLPEDVAKALGKALEKARAREARAHQRMLEARERVGPSPGLMLPDHLTVAWREPASYSGVAWFQEVSVVLAMTAGGQCSVLDRNGARIGAFVAAPNLTDAVRWTPAMLADDFGDPVPGVVVASFDGRLVGLDLTGLPLWTTELGSMARELVAADLDDDGFDEIIASVPFGRSVICTGAGGEPFWVRESSRPGLGLVAGDFLERAGEEIALSGFRDIDVIGPQAEALATWNVGESVLRPSAESRNGELDAILTVTSDQRLVRSSADAPRHQVVVAPVGLEALVRGSGGSNADAKGEKTRILGRAMLSDGSGVVFVDGSAQLVFDDQPFEMEGSLTAGRCQFALIPGESDGEPPILLVAAHASLMESGGTVSGPGGLTAISLVRPPEVR